MPARIGIIDTLKIPLATIAQYGPTKFAKRSNMGRLSAAELYEKRKESLESRNTTFDNYRDFRFHANRFDPNKQETTSAAKVNAGAYFEAVDQNEWDLYLKPGTAFDNTVKATLDKKEGWTVTFVSEKHHQRRKELKRLEAKRGLGHMSITLWSAKGSAADALAG